MTITHNNLPPCILTEGVEFFAVAENKVKAFHRGSIIDFDKLPKQAYVAIKNKIGASAESVEELEPLVFKYWGGCDSQPDLDANWTPGQSEYLENVNPAHFDNGKEISEGRLRILKLMHFPNKAIAEILFLSEHTVANHVQAIQEELGINNRASVVKWAKDKGIV